MKTATSVRNKTSYRSREKGVHYLPSNQEFPAQDHAWGEHSGEKRSSVLNHGKGPKGFHRADARIREDIQEMLKASDRLDASEITIRVKAGEAELSGRVRKKTNIRLAEGLVALVVGVTGVTNLLRIRHQQDNTKNRKS
jgi:osmotically-inducible protein OsmY